MKQLKYIIIAFIAGCILYGCSEDPIDKSMSSSDFFVTFDTRSGEAKSIAITEGDTSVVYITIAATKGSSITVDFDVTAPQGLPESVAYQLLNMDNTPMTGKSLTFPEGTGRQSFKFVSADNEIEDGTRVFTLKITGNSANYRNGVNVLKEGETLAINVKDDEIPILMEELLGVWQITERMYDNGWPAAETYTLTVEAVDENTISIRGWQKEDVIAVLATVDLVPKVKTITIPFQKLAVVLEDGYDTYFFKYASAQQGWGDQAGFNNLVLDKDDAGVIKVVLGTGNTYTIGAAEAGTMNYAGFFCLGAATTLTKLP